MQVHPLGNRVLIQLSKEEEMTKSGIVITVGDKEKKSEGIIIAVGTGKVTDGGTTIPMTVSVGQKVLVKSWGGDEVVMDGETYKIFDADDILAILS
ncbi:MAG: co-chaperone GroES [Candidatus Magasanikbacteria bacterium]|jgi:chaperonin GroES|nr:co-chaperone GroES [Candidatus Magasanikbacteria bacterium]